MNRLPCTLSLLALAGGLMLTPFPARAKDSPALDLARQLNQAFIEVADRVSPAVVVISVAHKPDFGNLDEEGNPFFEFLPKRFRQQFEDETNKRSKRRSEPQFDGQGSGVVVREDGYILTNRHVVDGAEKIKVRFRDGKEYPAEIRGVDAQSDIAVIKIDARNLPVAKFADSAKTRVGEFAIAIGAPFSLDYSVTFGHVSAKGRSNIIPDKSMDQDFIQTDANINPGNSGGPLVNIDGEIIGINTLIRGLRTGIGFAIPANMARDVSEKLISEGKFTRTWLGVEFVALGEYPEFKALARGVSDGMVVRSIVPDGPASKSDLKPADIITAVDGKTVTTSQQFRLEIRSKKIGAPVTLDVVRNGKPVKIKVKLDEWMDESMPVANRGRVPAEADAQDIGLTVKALTKDLAAEYGVTQTEGVVVVAVDRDSAAAQRGIKPGDIITEINQTKVSNPKQFREALKLADLKKGVIINLISQGVSKFELLKDGEK